MLLAHCHSDWKLASGKSKFLDARLKLTDLKKYLHAFDRVGSIVVKVAPLLVSQEFDIPLWTMSQFAAKKKFHVVLHPF